VVFMLVGVLPGDRFLRQTRTPGTSSARVRRASGRVRPAEYEKGAGRRRNGFILGDLRARGKKGEMPIGGGAA
jgi:hypothetical protein